MAASPRTLLFDLDGTLIDPARGLIASVRSALAALGAPVPPAEALGFVIGPPLRQTFPRLLGDDARVEEAVAAYRAAYGGGLMFEARVYDGVPEALAALAADGARLLVCTSKPHPYARRVLAHFGLLDSFAQVYGAELDGRFDDKVELMAHLVAQEGLAPERACMIGDRLFDMRAAKAAGIAALGVLWGYGDEAELRGHGADALCAKPADLPAAIARLIG
jgi:phosphoglycolate phosphatase